jgi:RHS repeat-associated protein
MYAKELQTCHHLNGYDYGARYYDPSLARWWNLDPKTEMDYSSIPYAYVVNNPIIATDPDGKFLNIVIGAAAGAILEMSSQITSTLVQGGSFQDALKNMDWADVLVSTGEGALVGSGVGAGVVFAAHASGSVLKAGIDFTPEKGLEIAGFDKSIKNTEKDLVGEVVSMASSNLIPADKLVGDFVAGAFVKNGIKSSTQFLNGIILTDLSESTIKGTIQGTGNGLYNKLYENTQKKNNSLLLSKNTEDSKKTHIIINDNNLNQINEEIKNVNYKPWN